MPYYPSEFTQVNPYINQAMVNLAMSLLNPKQTKLLPISFAVLEILRCQLLGLLSRWWEIEGLIH